MLFKYIDEHEIKPFNRWWRTDDDTIVTNSEAEQYALASGEWKPLIIDEEPTYNPETQYLSFHYEEVADAIRKVWDVIDIPDEATAEDYENALAEMGVNTDET